MNFIMFESTLQAYMQASYHIATQSGNFALRIGEYSPPLATLYSSHGAHSSCYITASNPLGVETDEAANSTANRRLHAELQGLGYCVFEGDGASDDAIWPSEKSYLALGTSPDDARTLCEKYDQNAVVYIGEDAVPMLLIHPRALLTKTHAAKVGMMRCGTLALISRCRR